MATEVDRLVVVFDANFSRMEEKLNSVIRTNQRAAKKVEQSWKTTGLKAGIDDLTSSFTSASQSIPGLGSALGAIGPAALGATLAVGALVVAFNSATAAMAWGDELAAMATKIGIGTEALQELEFAAEETDVPIEALHTGLQKLNGALGAMKTGVGDKKVKEAFEFLRIKPEELKGMNDASDLLPLIADRLQHVGTQAEQVQLAKKLGIQELLPMLQGGASGLLAMKEEAHALGLVIDDEMVQSLADADRQMEISTKVIKANLLPIFAGLAVEIGKAAQAVSDLIAWFRRLDKEHPKIMATLNRLDPAKIGFDAGNWVRGKLGLPQMQAPAAVAPRARKAAAIATGDEPFTPPAKTGGGKTRRAQVKEVASIIEAGEALTAAEMQARLDLMEALKFWQRVEESGKEPIKLFDTSGLVTAEEQMDKLLAPLRQAQEELENGVYSGIRGGLEAGFKDGLPGMLDYLQDALKKSVLDSVAEGLTSALLKGSQNGQTGGGLLGGIATLLSGLFGAKPHAAGALSTGGLALVGERGPELVNLPGGSQVLSNSKLRNVGIGSGAPGGQTIVFDNRGAVIWEQAARQMMNYADRAAGTAGVVALQASRRATPNDLARSGGRRLGR